MNKFDANPTIIGYVTHLSPDQVRGFAFSTSSDEALTVSLYFGDELITTQIANQESTILKDRELPAMHAFHFELKALGAFHMRDAISVRVNSEALQLTPHLNVIRFKHGFHKPSNQALFFFMHIPKTAGTSFRMLLNRQFDQDDIWPNKKVLADNGKRYPAITALRDLDKNVKRDTKLVLGHYPMWALRFMNVRPRIITFLRKPEDQLLSLAIHKKARTPALQDKTLEYIVENEIMDNPQTYFFLPAHIPTTQLSDDIFEVVKRNLKYCTFVGVRERFDEGLDYLESQFDWKLGKRITKNVGEKTNISEELKQMISAKCYYDKKLYKIALDQFDQLITNK